MNKQKLSPSTQTSTYRSVETHMQLYIQRRCRQAAWAWEDEETDCRFELARSTRHHALITLHRSPFRLCCNIYLWWHASIKGNGTECNPFLALNAHGQRNDPNHQHAWMKVSEHCNASNVSLADSLSDFHRPSAADGCSPHKMHESWMWWMTQTLWILESGNSWPPHVLDPACQWQDCGYTEVKVRIHHHLSKYGLSLISYVWIQLVSQQCWCHLIKQITVANFLPSRVQQEFCQDWKRLWTWTNREADLQCDW